MLRRLLILGALALALTLTGCSGKHGCDVNSTSCTRVLFVGNSYTFVNELPGMFAKLAGSAGVDVATTMVAEGGATLADHASAAETTAALASERWNYVVLQEQSEIPSIEQFRQQQMYPAARTLVGMVRGAGAVPIFFLTWAHRDGWPENGLTDYAAMQSAIDDGYLTIAEGAERRGRAGRIRVVDAADEGAGGGALAGRRQPPDGRGDVPRGVRLLCGDRQAEPRGAALPRRPVRRGSRDGSAGRGGRRARRPAEVGTALITTLRG